jgi:hypothetical protein
LVAARIDAGARDRDGLDRDHRVVVADVGDERLVTGAGIGVDLDEVVAPDHGVAEIGQKAADV